MRFLLASFIIGSLLFLTKRLFLPPKRMLLVLLFLGGIGYFLQSTLYLTSLLFVQVSVAVLVLYTYPVFVIGISLLLGLEKVTGRLTASLVLALSGSVLVVNPIFKLDAIGVLLALGASMVYTIYILISNRVIRKVSGEVSTFYIFLSSAISFGLLGLTTGGYRIEWSNDTWFWIIMIALFSTILPVLLFFRGLKLIGPSRASILNTAEIITSVIAASIIFQEMLLPIQMLGGIFIIAANVLISLSGEGT